jgi:hypothetical protein
MTLDEALEQCAEEKPIGNRVGDKEVLIRFLPAQNCYSLEECRLTHKLAHVHFW